MNQPMLTTGQIINNRYRIVRLMGQGGFGAIYRAWDLNLQKACALKQNLDASKEAERQFFQEATLLAQLAHPNLPRVTDHFSLPGQGQFLAMDFVEGEDMETMIERAAGPLPEAQALHWITQVCDALQYLHSQNPPVIHRDVKPANVRITPDGRAMLVDFGIAKVYDPYRKTTLGAQAVTPGYSPFEQYGQGKTDARSDIYALAATLYTALTGEIPPESIQRIGQDTLLPPRHFNPQVSPQVEQAILKALSLQPAARFQTARDFKDALSEKPSPAPTSVAPVAVAPTAVIQSAQSASPGQPGAPFLQPFGKQQAFDPGSSGGGMRPVSGVRPPAEPPWPASVARPRARSTGLTCLLVGAGGAALLVLVVIAIYMGAGFSASTSGASGTSLALQRTIDSMTLTAAVNLATALPTIAPSPATKTRYAPTSTPVPPPTQAQVVFTQVQQPTRAQAVVAPQQPVQPQPTMTPWPTPAPLQPFFTASQDMYCRGGPGTEYEAHYSVKPGQVLPVLARWENGWLLLGINDPEKTRTRCCWVGGDGTLNVDLSSITLISYLPDRINCPLNPP